jgi:Tol biopolymer transport system component
VRFCLLLTVMFWGWGCASPIRYAPLPVDPAWELLYVSGDGSINIDPADSTASYCIYWSGAQVLFPRCSPDRTQVAFYQFSDRRGALRVVETKGEASEQERKWAESVADIEGPAGYRMALFPPLWSPDGRSVMLVDQSGIYRIAMDRQHERIVDKEDIVALTIAPDGKRMAFADGERIVLATMDGAELSSFTTTTAALPERQEVEPIAFSPNGGKIAYGAGRFLFTLDLQSMKSRKVTEVEDPIYWVQWLPGQERLVFTTGLSIINLRTSMSATPYRIDHGSYTLFSVGTNGRGRRRLFEDGDMDVYLAEPTLSPDGAYVALVAGGEESAGVVVVATDAPRVVALTATEVSSHPSWIPRLGPAEPGPATAPCPVLVVYPVR